MNEFSILTVNKNVFDYSDVKNCIINSVDIVNALSHINRFGGHTKTPYSVGQHTLLCHSLVDEHDNIDVDRIKQLMLLHDFHEAYFGDIPSPLKRYIKKQFGFNINKYCDQIDKVIYKKFNVEPPTTEEKELVKYYDYLALGIEQKFLQDYDNFECEPFDKYQRMPYLIHHYEEFQFNKFLFLQPGTVAIQLLSLLSKV